MRLLRGIYATAWAHDIRITFTSHIKGERNIFADAASRLSAQTPERLRSLQLVDDTRLAPQLPPWLPHLAMAHAHQQRAQQQQH
jgi:hypothetical protein